MKELFSKFVSKSYKSLKISIITVVYNSCKTIEDAIDSVASQKYSTIEYIIVDGNSTDGTVNIIKQHEKKITKWISEPDKGIYDAMNKGLSLATGDVIGILNADDFYSDNEAIEKVMNAFAEGDIDGVYTDLVYVTKSKDKVTRYWKSGDYKNGNFLWGWMPPHPAFFAKREIYLKYGFFNPDLRQSSDYELMLRFIHKNRIKLKYIPEILVKMRIGGISNSSLNNRIKAYQEDREAWRINDLKPYFFTIWIKSLRKIPQYFLRPS